jgi:hypothetical protein
MQFFPKKQRVLPMVKRGPEDLLTIGKSSLLQDLNYYKAVRVGPITHREIVRVTGRA